MECVHRHLSFQPERPNPPLAVPVRATTSSFPLSIVASWEYREDGIRSSHRNRKSILPDTPHPRPSEHFPSGRRRHILVRSPFGPTRARRLRAFASRIQRDNNAPLLQSKPANVLLLPPALDPPSHRSY